MGCPFGNGRFSDGHIYLLPACCHGGMVITKKEKKKKSVTGAQGKELERKT